MEEEQRGNARSELDNDRFDENIGKNVPFFLPSYDDMNHRSTYWSRNRFWYGYRTALKKKR